MTLVGTFFYSQDIPFHSSTYLSDAFKGTESFPITAEPAYIGVISLT